MCYIVHDVFRRGHPSNCTPPPLPPSVATPPCLVSTINCPSRRIQPLKNKTRFHSLNYWWRHALGAREARRVDGGASVVVVKKTIIPVRATFAFVKLQKKNKRSWEISSWLRRGAEERHALQAPWRRILKKKKTAKQQVCCGSMEVCRARRAVLDSSRDRGLAPNHNGRGAKVTQLGVVAWCAIPVYTCRQENKRGRLQQQYAEKKRTRAKVAVQVLERVCDG